MSSLGARQVGELPERARPIIRQQINPMDKATIVSIYPRPIYEVKHTIFPGSWHIPAGSVKEPSVTVISPSTWVLDNDLEKPAVQIVVSATQLAESIINDYCRGLLGADIFNTMPGMFFIPGEISRIEVITKYKDKIVSARTKQEEWYKVLIKLADALWSRSNGNPLVIWDEMRFAAEVLDFKDKPWMQNTEHFKAQQCPVCGTFGKPGFPVCSSCHHIIDVELYNKLGLKKVE